MPAANSSVPSPGTVRIIESKLRDGMIRAVMPFGSRIVDIQCESAASDELDCAAGMFLRRHLLLFWNVLRCLLRTPKDHMHIGILHSGSRSQDKEDSRDHGL